jgi:protein LTV1
MQHLRPTGGGSDAIFVEAPKRKQDKRALRLPIEVLPAAEDTERDYNELVGIPERPYGLQPDMDPRLREALEALEDEAFVDDELMDDGDGFFDALVAGGEGEPDAEEWEDEEDGEAGAYELEMERFEAPKGRPGASEDEGEDDSLDFGSEAGDTIAALRASSARRPPRPPMSAMSGMSASTMNRSVGLQNLDDQFDKVWREDVAVTRDE